MGCRVTDSNSSAVCLISVTADPDPLLYSLTNACEPASPAFDFVHFIRKMGLLSSRIYRIWLSI